MVKICRLSTNLRLLSWWLYNRGPFPLGAWVQPSATNDHHLWSLRNGKLWRSPYHTLQSGPMSPTIDLFSIKLTSKWGSWRLKLPASWLFTQLFFRHRSKKTSKVCVTGLCEGNSPGTGEFPTQKARYAGNVSIWWRHHVYNAEYDTGKPCGPHTPINIIFCVWVSSYLLMIALFGCHLIYMGRKWALYICIAILIKTHLKFCFIENPKHLLFEQCSKASTLHYVKFYTLFCDK